MQPIEMRPIGVVRSPFTIPEGAPIQPGGAAGVRGRIVLDPAYQAGLQDLAGFSHIHLLYFFHLARPFSLTVTPFLDTVARGLFATRAPSRPNAIGISVVRLISVTGNILEVEDIDVVDGTPLLDIKPYVPQFDARPAERIGWMSATVSAAGETRADGRFVRPPPEDG
jgi:tRNA-Thr(GGU) m(6)t(6)A37 methyltransferase TsaA